MRASFACEDPEWDALLSALPEALAGTGSRVLITCRHLVGALSKRDSSVGAASTVGAVSNRDSFLHIRLETLPNGEAVLFARRHPALRRLLFGDVGQQLLARRILTVSRGHPLLLDRLARLADLPQPGTLQDALKQLESRADFSKLPDLFSSGAKDQQAERACLLDALHTSLDNLLELAGAEARHLLWVLSLADDPVPEEVLRVVWSGRSLETDMKPPLDMLLALGLVMAEAATPVVNPSHAVYPVIPAGMPESSHKDVDLPADTGPRSSTDASGTLPSMALDSGIPAGMAELQAKPRMATTEESAAYTCHELTRERIAAWMQARPDERRNRDEKQIGIGYAERWAALFGAWFHQNQDAALEMGRRALVGFVRAGAYDQLGGFASNLIGSTRDPRVLNALRPSLEVAAAQAPAGQARWRCRCYLADALRQAGQYEASLDFYAEAEAEARAQDHWADVAWITGN